MSKLNNALNNFFPESGIVTHLSQDEFVNCVEQTMTSYEYVTDPDNWKSDDKVVVSFIAGYLASLTKNAVKKEAKRLKNIVARLKKQSNRTGVGSVACTDAKAHVSADADADADIDALTEEEYKEMRLKEFDDAGINPWPHKFHRTTTFQRYLKNWSHLGKGAESDFNLSIAGQVIGKRCVSKSLFFYTLESYGNYLQVISSRKNYADADTTAFDLINRLIRRGDIIGVNGHPHRTKRGELSIAPTSMQVLTPCLCFIDKIHKTDAGAYQSSFTDIESRFRRRYEDLKLNPDKRLIFRTRAKALTAIRGYFDCHPTVDFLEVETPILSSIGGGANAKPFVTYSHSSKMELSMRVAPELRLKELIVGGLSDGVYELGRVFRNESPDATHLIQFTSLEYYVRYWDYHDLMVMTNEFLPRIVNQVTGSKKTLWTPSGSTESIEIDWSGPYPILDVMVDLPHEIRMNGVPEFEMPKDLSGSDARDYLDATLVTLDIECGVPRTTARLLDKLIGELLEPKCQNPTFIINHPQIMSPLAKYHRSIPQATERFELFVAGTELCNAYTELNDPVKQEECFRAQQAAKDDGDDEAQLPDSGYVHALDVGLPPTAGWGMGVDRFVMFMTNNASIREVVLFPDMKSTE